jgi:hypothetical protein
MNRFTSFPALQSVMLVIQVLVAPFLFVFNFRLPALPFQQLSDSENRIFKMVIAVDAVCVLNQVAVIDISPHLTIPNFRYVPGGMIDGSGYELGKLC